MRRKVLVVLFMDAADDWKVATGFYEVAERDLSLGLEAWGWPDSIAGFCAKKGISVPTFMEAFPGCAVLVEKDPCTLHWGMRFQELKLPGGQDDLRRLARMIHMPVVRYDGTRGGEPVRVFRVEP